MKAINMRKNYCLLALIILFSSSGTLGMESSAWSLLHQEPYGTKSEMVKIFKQGSSSYRAVIVNAQGKEESEVEYFRQAHVRHASINLVWTDERFRRRGLARVLVLRTCGHLASLGCERVTLLVVKNNHPARCLYEQCGFVKKCTSPRESSSYWYEKQLKA